MAVIPEQQVPTLQHDQAQVSKTGDVSRRNPRLYGLVFAIVATIIAAGAVAAVVLSGPEESTMKVAHAEDHSNTMSMAENHPNTMPMGHLQLTEWAITSMAGSVDREIGVGNSTLEVHNDGHTVHSLTIWRGGEVQGDQVVGGTLVAQTAYIQPGGVAPLEVDLEPGEYLLVCGVRGHAARGMHAKVVLR